MMTESEGAGIARRLKIAREHAGLSQGQAAKLMGMHRPTVSEIEAGRRRVTVDELSLFASTYEVDIEWLAANKTPNKEEVEKIELAARELGKLDKKDLDGLLNLLATMRKVGKKT